MGGKSQVVSLGAAPTAFLPDRWGRLFLVDQLGSWVRHWLAGELADKPEGGTLPGQAEDEA